MSSLNDQDIRDAAAEAGISPGELRQAMADQGRDLPARIGPGASTALAVPASQAASVVLQARANLPQPPDDAVRNVRSSIEGQLGLSGHMQGEGGASIYDEDRGLIYRLRSEDDGQGGALVQVDIDAAPARGRQTLAKFGVGAAVLALGLGSWLFGSFVAFGVTVGLGVLGFGTIAAKARSNKAIQNQAHAVASHALIEAEERGAAPPKALRPS